METAFALTDVARMHYWTGDGFIPVDEAGVLLDDVLCFHTVRAANREARRQWRRGCHLRVFTVGVMLVATHTDRMVV